jgi:hypothetical protein
MYKKGALALKIASSDTRQIKKKKNNSKNKNTQKKRERESAADYTLSCRFPLRQPPKKKSRRSTKFRQ